MSPDLLAIAFVRRVLLELGAELPAPARHRTGPYVSPIELWIRESRPELSGKTPIEILATPGGDSLLRQCIERLAHRVPGEPSQGGLFDGDSADRS